MVSKWSLPLLAFIRKNFLFNFEWWSELRQGVILPSSRAHLALSVGIFGRHDSGEGCCWHMAGRGQGCCQTFYDAQTAATTENDPVRMLIVPMLGKPDTEVETQEGQTVYVGLVNRELSIITHTDASPLGEGLACTEIEQRPSTSGARSG